MGSVGDLFDETEEVGFEITNTGAGGVRSDRVDADGALRDEGENESLTEVAMSCEA